MTAWKSQRRKNSFLPSHIDGTQREWKKRKRQELRAARKAFYEFLTGCAYTPLKDGEVGTILRLFDSMQEKLSAKTWGR